MNLAVFVVIVVRERETELGDDIEALAGIGRPAAARLAADDRDAGPGRSARDLGVHGQALPDRGDRRGDYTWLGVAIVIGTMVSLAYYLRVVAAVWMRPGRAARGAARPSGPMPGDRGGSPEGGAVAEGRQPLRTGRRLRLLCAAATVAFGVAPAR